MGRAGSPGTASAGGAGTVPLHVEIADPSRLLTPAQVSWLHAHALLVLDAIGAPGEVRARLVGDTAMAEAHERHTGVGGTTDVLTFDLSDESPAGRAESSALDTDLLLCVDEAARRAAERAHSTERELLLYLVHGVLHCLGYDDHTQEDARRMHAREDELLETIGVGATYAATKTESGRVAEHNAARGGAA